MDLDPRFIVTSDLDTYYVDKDTYAPLSGGIVTFFSDINRSQLKPVYQLTGSPPNYNYAPLPNPIILNGDGTFSDNNGNNIVPYYFPYAGVPDDNNNNIELYYITVQSSTNVPQFNRQGWPNFTQQDIVTENAQNFIPGGQFLLHNNGGSQAIDTTTDPSRKIYQIAQGGWTFEIPTGSSSVNEISFEPFNSYIPTFPTKSPEFSCRVKCITPDPGDTFKDLCLTFEDVNKFSSDTQEFTYYFEAISNSGSPLDVDIYVRKNYGENGSPSQDIFIGTLTINTTYSPNSIVFTFGANTGKNIGLNSFVQLIIRSPVTSASDYSITNTVMAQDEVLIQSFPTTTNQEFITNSLGTIPNPDPDGFDLYLPLKYGPKGYYFDDSEIGDIIAKTTNDFTNSISNRGNELLCDGNSYLTANYSPLGIPFSRLQQKIFIDNSNYVGPIWGTGNNFALINFLNNTNSISLTINNPGVVSPRTNAGTSTFTVSNFSIVTVPTNYQGYVNGSNSFILTSNIIRSSISFTTASASGSSNFTVFPYTESLGTKPTYQYTLSSLPAASSYISFYNVVTNSIIYVWFKINGIGTNPSLGGIGIEVDLLNTDTVANVIGKIASACAGKQIDRINTNGLTGTTIIQNSYFTFNAGATNYYAWFNVDGTGIDPNPGGTGIEITINSIYSAFQVIQAISRGINSYQFATPDLRGFFLRGVDSTNNNDVLSLDRYNIDGSYDSGGIGSFQNDTFSSHLHSITDLHGTNPSTEPVDITAFGGGSSSVNSIVTSSTNNAVDTPTGIARITANVLDIRSNGDTDYEGFGQTTPINTAINWAIKY